MSPISPPAAFPRRVSATPAPWGWPAGWCVACGVAALAAGCDVLAPGPPAPAPPTGPRAVYALGSLEPAGGVIAISATPGDRLKALDADVAVNARVPADGVLGVMASYDARRAQLEAIRTKRTLTRDKHRLEIEAADARVGAARASLAQAEAKLAEAAAQQQRLAYLGEAAAIARQDLALLRRLAREDPELITPMQLRKKSNLADRVERDHQVARQTIAAGLRAAELGVEAARAGLASAQRSRELLGRLSPVVATDEEVRLAEQSLVQSVLLAPGVDAAEFDAASVSLGESGPPPGRFTVLSVLLQPGEAVAQTPVLELGDLSSVVCVAEVYEADAKRIAIGQQATITSTALADSFAEGIRGTVERVARLVASPGLTSRNPLAPIDRSVVEVRVAIDPQDAAATAEAGRWIGLQVQVEFTP